MAIYLDKHKRKAYKRRKQIKVINFTFLQTNFILIPPHSRGYNRPTTTAEAVSKDQRFPF